jgi:hypothetical protein
LRVRIRSTTIEKQIANVDPERLAHLFDGAAGEAMNEQTSLAL